MNKNEIEIIQMNRDILQNHEKRIIDLETMLNNQELNKVGKLINCSKCKYKWVTRSKSIKVSCPSCGQKTENSYNPIMNKEKENMDE